MTATSPTGGSRAGRLWARLLLALHTGRASRHTTQAEAHTRAARRHKDLAYRWALRLARLSRPFVDPAP